jgi:hypothetical protein
MQQPAIRPTFRCLPERVSGIPRLLDIFPFAEEMPKARLHDQENPNFVLRRDMIAPGLAVIEIGRPPQRAGRACAAVRA